MLALFCSEMACGGNARSAQDATLLANPSAATAFQFSEIYNVIELADGRVVLADGRAKVVFAGSLDTGTFDTVGQVGSGPGQYQIPAYVFPVSDNVFVLVDIGLWRVTKWSGNGSFLGDWKIPASRIFGVDSVGRLYASQFVPPPTSDSIYLFRWSAGTARMDTIARVRGVEFYRVERPQGYQLTGIVYGYRPAFGVFPDGTVWVARDDPYRVDLMSSDGRWTAGVARGYEPIRVTGSDRRVIRDVWGEPGAHVGPDPHFANTKAPFQEGVTDASGTIWLHRYTAGDDSLPLYDLYDHAGRYVRSIRLPFGYRVMGFGAENRVYAVRRDRDGLMQVARFQMTQG